MNKPHTERLNAIDYPEHAINKAAQHLAAGELVALPTETVYGLAASAFNEAAITRIFDVKKRPNDNPLIVHCANMADVEKVAIDIPPIFTTLSAKFFPGPLTILLKKHPAIPNCVTAGLDTVAVRIPAHNLTRRIIAKLGVPVVAPSANLSGNPSPTSAEHVFTDLNGKIASVVDGGACEIGIESTIVNILTSPPQILRPGIITKAELENIANCAFVEVHDNKNMRAIAPGMKYRHYAPKAQVRLLNNWNEVYSIIENEPACRRKVLATRTQVEIAGIPIRNLSEHSLYAEFRAADENHMSEILVVCDSTIQARTGLMNRLQKASAK